MKKFKGCLFTAAGFLITVACANVGQAQAAEKMTQNEMASYLGGSSYIPDPTGDKTGQLCNSTGEFSETACPPRNGLQAGGECVRRTSTPALVCSTEGASATSKCLGAKWASCKTWIYTSTTGADGKIICGNPPKDMDPDIKYYDGCYNKVR